MGATFTITQLLCEGWHPSVVFFLLLAEAHEQLERRFAPFAAVWDDYEVGAAARCHQ